MSNKEPRPYEGNAERVTVTGWKCMHCRAFYGNVDGSKHRASWCCCTDRPCEIEGCDGRASKGYVACQDCQAKEHRRREEAVPVGAWDTDEIFVNGDLYYQLCDYLGDCEELPTAESLSLDCSIPMRVLAPKIDLEDFILSDAPEGCELSDDVAQAEADINAIIERVSPNWWEGSNARPSPDALRPYIEAERKSRGYDD